MYMGTFLEPIQNSHSLNFTQSTHHLYRKKNNKSRIDKQKMLSLYEIFLLSITIAIAWDHFPGLKPVSAALSNAADIDMTSIIEWERKPSVFEAYNIIYGFKIKSDKDHDQHVVMGE